MVEGLLAGEGAAGHGQLKRLVHAGRQAGLHFTIVNNLAVFSYNGNVIVTFLFLYNNTIFYNIYDLLSYLPKLE